MKMKILVTNDDGVFSEGLRTLANTVKTLGEAFKTRTRHLAAIGLSQETDAAVIVVSEESGEVSLATRGKLHKALNKEDLEERVIHYLQR